MIHIIRKILTWLGWAVIGLLILSVSFVMWGNKNGWEFDAVLSGSMEPAFNVGGLVVIMPVNAETLKIGDAISFKLPDVKTPICHRIIDIQYQDGEKFFQTKGDANEEADIVLIPLSSVKGKAIFHTPYVGRLAEVKNLGTTRIPVLGQRLPAATLFVLVLGLLFIGLTLKDTAEYILFPGKRWKREMVRKHSERLLKRRRTLGIK